MSAIFKSEPCRVMFQSTKYWALQVFVSFPFTIGRAHLPELKNALRFDSIEHAHAAKALRSWAEVEVESGMILYGTLYISFHYPMLFFPLPCLFSLLHCSLSAPTTALGVRAYLTPVTKEALTSLRPASTTGMDIINHNTSVTFWAWLSSQQDKIIGGLPGIFVSWKRRERVEEDYTCKELGLKWPLRNHPELPRLLSLKKKATIIKNLDKYDSDCNIFLLLISPQTHFTPTYIHTFFSPEAVFQGHICSGHIMVCMTIFQRTGKWVCKGNCG